MFLVLSLLPFVIQFEVQLEWVSLEFIPPSTSLCPEGWEDGLECPSLFLDPLLSGPLIYTLDADSNASQPALNKKKGVEEVKGIGGRKEIQTGQSWE